MQAGGAGSGGLGADVGWFQGGARGVRVDVNEELKFLGKFKKMKTKIWWGVGLGGGGVRVDVNEELRGSGGGSGWWGGQGGCERNVGGRG